MRVKPRAVIQIALRERGTYLGSWTTEATLLDYICIRHQETARGEKGRIGARRRDWPTQTCWKRMIVADKLMPMSRFEEAAGETAAECAAVLCCCPCGLASLLLAAAIKLPAGVLWQAVRRRRKRYRGRQKAGLKLPRLGFSDDEEDGFSVHGGLLWATGVDEAWAATKPSQEMLELEEQMLATFDGAGFWRSSSQKE